MPGETGAEAAGAKAVKTVLELVDIFKVHRLIGAGQAADAKAGAPRDNKNIVFACVKEVDAIIIRFVNVENGVDTQVGIRQERQQAAAGDGAARSAGIAKGAVAAAKGEGAGYK